MKTYFVQRKTIALTALVLASLLTLSLNYIATTFQQVEADTHQLQIAAPGGSQGNG